MSDEANNPEPELALENSDPAPEPVEVEDKQAVSEESDTTEAETVEAEASEGEGDQENSAPEFVTVEYDGMEYDVPPQLKDALLRHGDYTKKTIELSTQRKAVEEHAALLEQQAAFQKETFEDVAAVRAIDQQIEQYNALNWPELYQQDVAQAASLNHQKQELESQRQQTINRLEQRRVQFESQRAEQHAKAIEQGQEVLKKEIEGWSTEMREQIAEYGVSQGLSPQAVGSISDPVHVKLLDKARRYDELVAKQKAKPKAPTEPPKAAVKVKGKRANAAKDPDKMNMKEWLAMREKQIASRTNARA
tara:strand:+ start:2040 stop:2957 length:918 start_codon:yes stop_codon:yes gene_type:complete